MVRVVVVAAALSTAPTCCCLLSFTHTPQLHLPTMLPVLCSSQASRILAQLLVAGATTVARAASQAWAQALQSACTIRRNTRQPVVGPEVHVLQLRLPQQLHRPHVC